MKITFIEPPNWTGKESFERVFGCNLTIYPFPNIFTLITAGLLKNKGYDVVYIDAANMYWNEDEFDKFIQNDCSDIISIHSINLAKENDLLTLEKIRKIKKDVKIIFTGPSPTMNPGDFIKDNNVFVVRGEQELTFLEFVTTIKEKKNYNDILGLSYGLNGAILNNPVRELIEDLDSLPFPDRTLLDRDLYFCPKIGKEPWTTVLTSRGCSYRCIYCVPCSLSFSRELEYKSKYGKKPPVRKRSAKNVIEEIKLLKSQGYRSFTIIDDNFPWEQDRTLEICRGIEELGFEWGCLSRADRITEQIAAAFTRSGCQFVDIGVESFDQAVLDYVKKDMKIETIYRAVDILKKYKIDVKFNILLGASPLETEDIILNNLKIIKKLKPSTVMFSIVSPFPGTEYYETCKKNGWFSEGDYYSIPLHKQAIVSYPDLTSVDLERLIKKLTFKYYLRPGFFLSSLKRIKSPRGLLRGLVSLKRKLSFGK